MERSHENVIEFFDDQERAALTLSKQRYITRVKKLAEQYPDDVDVYQNKDGTIFAHVPVTWIKISPKVKQELSGEEHAIRAERFRQNVLKNK